MYIEYILEIELEKEREKLNKLVSCKSLLDNEVLQQSQVVDRLIAAQNMLNKIKIEGGIKMYKLEIEKIKNIIKLSLENNNLDRKKMILKIIRNIVESDLLYRTSDDEKIDFIFNIINEYKKSKSKEEIIA